MSALTGQLPSIAPTILFPEAVCNVCMLSLPADSDFEQAAQDARFQEQRVLKLALMLKAPMLGELARIHRCPLNLGAEVPFAEGKCVADVFTTWAALLDCSDWGMQTLQPAGLGRCGGERNVARSSREHKSPSNGIGVIAPSEGCQGDHLQDLRQHLAGFSENLTVLEASLPTTRAPRLSKHQVVL